MKIAARLGIALLGERGDAAAGTRCEWTDHMRRALPPRLRARLPPEVVHVRRPISEAEQALLPEWFNGAEPIDLAGDGTIIELP